MNKKEKKIEDKKARDFCKHPKSKIVADWFEDGIRIVILACRGSHFTAYFGVPEGHPLAGFDYDDIPLDVHGGLTYSSGKSEVLPKGYWFYGWDYAHVGDVTYFDGEPSLSFYKDDHDWTLKEVKEEADMAFYNFRRLVKLAEKLSK